MKKRLPFAAFVLLFLSTASPAYAGTFCAEFWDCPALFTILILSKYALGIVGAIFLLVGALKLFKSIIKSRPLSTITVLFLFIGIVLIAYNAYSIYKNEHRYAAEDKKEAVSADFDLYMPRYIPEGFYNLQTTMLITDKNNSYLHFTYNNMKNRDLGQLIITEYNRSKNPYPQADCGLSIPDVDYLLPSCRVVGKTEDGVKIYMDGQENREYLGMKGETITVNGNTNIAYSKTRIVINETILPKEELLKMARSFKKVYPDEIDFKTSFR